MPDYDHYHHHRDRDRVRTRVRLPLVLAALVALAGCTGVPDGITPVRDFDAARYAGRWYEIVRLDHRFERGLSNVTAVYTLNRDGTVRVQNRGYDTQECEWREADGQARFRGPPTVGSLSVTFFPPFAGGYHVFALDRERYSYAMIAGPSRSYFWILAREPRLPADVRDRLIGQARAAGFAVDDLLTVEHGEPRCAKADARARP